MRVAFGVICPSVLVEFYRKHPISARQRIFVPMFWRCPGLTCPPPFPLQGDNMEVDEKPSSGPSPTAIDTVMTEAAVPLPPSSSAPALLSHPPPNPTANPTPPKVPQASSFQPGPLGVPVSKALSQPIPSAPPSFKVPASTGPVAPGPAGTVGGSEIRPGPKPTPSHPAHLPTSARPAGAQSAPVRPGVAVSGTGPPAVSHLKAVQVVTLAGPSQQGPSNTGQPAREGSGQPK
jgi:hypothetical protein